MVVGGNDFHFVCASAIVTTSLALASTAIRLPDEGQSIESRDTANVLSDLCVRFYAVLWDAPMPFLDRDCKFDSRQMRTEASVRTGAPNKRWRFGGRSRMNSPALASRCGSRFEAAVGRTTRSPARIGQPANSTSRVTRREVVTIAGVRRRNRRHIAAALFHRERTG